MIFLQLWIYHYLNVNKIRMMCILEYLWVNHVTYISLIWLSFTWIVAFSMWWSNAFYVSTFCWSTRWEYVGWGLKIRVESIMTTMTSPSFIRMYHLNLLYNTDITNLIFIDMRNSDLSFYEHYWWFMIYYISFYEGCWFLIEWMNQQYTNFFGSLI